MIPKNGCYFHEWMNSILAGCIGVVLKTRMRETGIVNPLKNVS